MNQYEISKLKKQLLRKNDIIKQMQQDFEFVQKQLVTSQAERDKYYGELQIARNTIENVDQIIEQRVHEMRTKLEHENSTSLNELQSLKQKVIEEKNLNERYNEEIRNKDAVISQLSARLREMSIKYKDPSLQVNVKEISEQASITYNQFYKLTEKYNRLSEDMENILAENKILRKLHGVPDNFGFDLEEIKIAEKQELEDYKAQCRKLETEIEELEAERTQLRYRLRQYNTLYSNKGERYKDMTQRQLQLLDAYALNLKEGKYELPEIDKSQKQMEREIIELRAKLQVLQNKTPMGLMPGLNKMQSSGEMSKDALKKLQQQIKSTLQPFVQDIRKLSQTNINSIIQNFQTIQAPSNQIILPTTGSSRLQPPQPLPITNNDWSTIREGYSYRYASKIPVDLKDYQGEIGYDQVKAKYEIAALQLQNIESLKMIKQKEDQEKVLRTELTELKEKFKKCLLIQDDLFVKFFKARDEFKEKAKQQKLDKDKFKDQRDSLRSQVAILRETLNAMNNKGEMEGKIKNFGERLAKSEAGLIKTERKLQILAQQNKIIRDSYTKMELKAAQNIEYLKKKYLTCKKNEKQLTMLMNQILAETKDSVSSDTHKLLRAKMEVLNDKTAHAAFKEADLRIKISRLQSIERDMNIKDEVIEYLREDKLDMLLELEILRNRLKAIDAGYRSAFVVLERLIGFLNQSNISIMEVFKKFDTDKSGTLSKMEYKRALDSLGFVTKNNQFDLLFNQFDLDGSGTINYHQFIRKLKRSGALNRSEQQKAIYLFFKAIKMSNISIRKAFQIIDKDGSNEISKAEMQTAFRQLGIDVDSRTIDAIFRAVDTDNSKTLTCSELEEFYATIIKDSELDEAEIKPELDWKYQFVLKVEESSVKNKMSMEECFKAFDDDGNSYMTINELSLFLAKLKINLESRYLDELFKFLDIRFDGKVEYGEFLKVLEEAKRERKRVDRLVAVQKRAEELKKENDSIIKENESSSKGVSEEAINKIKLMSLQTKQNNLVKRNEKLCKSLANKQQEIKQKERSIEEAEKELEAFQEKYHKEKQMNIALEQKMKNYIGEAEAKKLKQQVLIIKVDNNKLSTELQTYKGLVNSLTDKNKAELMSVEKIKAQLNKTYDIVKELQAENISKAELGRLALELEYSKRNQEIVNKKYEDTCDQTKVLAQQNHDLTNESLEKQKQIVNAYLLMKQKTNLLQKNIDSLTAQIMPAVTISKVDEIIAKLRKISTSKSELQQQNKQLRERNFNLQLKYDHIEIEKVTLRDLQMKLRNAYKQQGEVALINLTKQLSDLKLAELKNKREFNMLKEKEEYYMRINNANTDNIKELEEELAKWDIKFNEREQFWRKRMADQIKLSDDIKKQVEKVKEQELKSLRLFKEQQIQDVKLQEQYNNLSEEKERELSQFVKPPSVYRAQASNNQKIEELQAQISQMTQELQDKERQIYKLKTAIQEIVPEEKLRFSTIGSQIGSHQMQSFNLQTELTTSQLKNNARRFINSQKDQQAFFKAEAQKMAQAAQQSINTLQNIIDDKNQQIKRKDKLIDDLKREMLRTKQEDCYQIQKLNEQIRDLRSKTELNSLNQIMNKSTNKNFYPATGNQEDKINGLSEIINAKQAEIQSWERKYNELYISKNKVRADSSGNKLIENKLRELAEERDNERKKYAEAENKMKQKIKNLEKLSKDKDAKLAQLQKVLIELKQQVLEEKKELSHEKTTSNEDLVSHMLKGSTANDSKLEVSLQQALQTIQLLNKKLRESDDEIKRLREDSKFRKTMTKK